MEHGDRVMKPGDPVKVSFIDRPGKILFLRHEHLVLENNERYFTDTVGFEALSTDGNNSIRDEIDINRFFWNSTAECWELGPIIG